MAIFGEIGRELETQTTAPTAGAKNDVLHEGSQEPFFDPENPQHLLGMLRSIIDQRVHGSTHATRVTRVIDLCMQDSLPESDPVAPFVSFIPEDRLTWLEENAMTIRRLTAEDPDSPLEDRYYLEQDTEEIQKSQVFKHMALIQKLMPFPREIAEASIALKLLFAKAKADYTDSGAG